MSIILELLKLSEANDLLEVAYTIPVSAKCRGKKGVKCTSKPTVKVHGLYYCRRHEPKVQVPISSEQGI